MEFRFGVDLITFYHPSFWGAEDRQSFEKVALGDPRRFWDRIAPIGAHGRDHRRRGDLPSRQLGDGGEHLRIAGGVLGLPERCRHHLDQRLFQRPGGARRAPRARAPNARSWRRPARYAEFLGGEQRRARRRHADAQKDLGHSGEPKIRRLRLREGGRADLINQIGATTQRHGVRLALHPEVGSVFCVRRRHRPFPRPHRPGLCRLLPRHGPHPPRWGLPGRGAGAALPAGITISHWKSAPSGVGPTTTT